MTKHIIHALLTAARHKIGLRELVTLLLAQNHDSAQSIADFAGWKLTAAHSRITTLRDKGFVAKNVTDEARLKQLALTEKGKSVIAEIENQTQP